MDRKYELTIEELRTLIDLGEDATIGSYCRKCDDADDLCDKCQAEADLVQRLRDALSLAEAGVRVSFQVKL